MTRDEIARLRKILRRLVRYCQDRGACDDCGSLWCQGCPIREAKEEIAND